MDVTQEEELIQALSRIKLSSDPADSNTSGYYAAGGQLDPHYGAVPSLSTDQLPTLTISNLDSNINGLSYSNISIAGGGYTVGTGIGAYTVNAPTWSSGNSGKIQLQGEKADIDINGKSLKTWMELVEERLNILTPNAKLEEEWEELRVLGEQYRKLEQHIKDKQATWDRLKAMPPPIVE